MQINITDIKTEDVFSYFNKRDENANKGSFGRALLITGSYGMAGAAVICTNACVHSGVGIAHVVCPHSIYNIVSQSLPEAVFTPVNDVLTDDDKKAVITAIKKADCVVIGCGMGMNEYTLTLLDIALTHSKSPIIIDADGINVLSQNIELLQSASCPIILTPHPGEMSRLCGYSISDILSHGLSIMEQFVTKYNCTLVLKTHETTVMTANGDAFVNHTGNAGMATGGSGDMLCGIMAAFISQGLTPEKAATAAVHIHGLCGDLSAKKYSMIYTTPTTMQKALPIVFKELENFIDGD